MIKIEDIFVLHYSWLLKKQINPDKVIEYFGLLLFMSGINITNFT